MPFNIKLYYTPPNGAQREILKARGEFETYRDKLFLYDDEDSDVTFFVGTVTEVVHCPIFETGGTFLYNIFPTAVNGTCQRLRTLQNNLSVSVGDFISFYCPVEFFVPPNDN